jgi:hypothetical protein
LNATTISAIDFYLSALAAIRNMSNDSNGDSLVDIQNLTLDSENESDDDGIKAHRIAQRSSLSFHSDSSISIQSHHSVHSEDDEIICGMRAEVLTTVYNFIMEWEPQVLAPKKMGEVRSSCI